LPTVEQLGALYGELLAAHAGSSPCVIAGYSLGGKIAFEAARVLQRAGGNVAFVLLLDAQAFTWRRFILGPALESFFWIWRETAARKVDGAPLMERLSASLGDTWTIIRFLLLRVPAAMWNRFGAIMARFGKVTNRFSPTSNPSDTLSGYFDNEGRPIAMLDLHVLGQAMGRLWRPRPLDAAGVLIRAYNFEDMLPGYELANGWDNLFARGLEVVRTTGDHISMLSDEHTPVLARQMNLILDRYEAARAETTDAPGNNMDHRGTDGQRRFEQASSQPEPTDA
jgi:thioesterase domain-containing protein